MINKNLEEFPRNKNQENEEIFYFPIFSIYILTKVAVYCLFWVHLYCLWNFSSLFFPRKRTSAKENTTDATIPWKIVQ